jgi:hypothetical protein
MGVASLLCETLFVVLFTVTRKDWIGVTNQSPNGDYSGEIVCADHPTTD